MGSITETLTASWHLHPPIEALILLSAVVYTKGWWRLHHRRPDYFTLRHLLCFLAGEIALFVAIASPLHELAEISLMAHMIQHVLLMMVIPPLILLGVPHLVLLFGLPDAMLHGVLRPFLRWTPLKRVVLLVFHPVNCWIAFVGSTLAWHMTVMFELALRSEFWHAVEHFCFLGTAFLFWSPVIQPWPSRARWPRWAMIPYLVLADFQNSALSAFLIFYDRVLYPTYATMPHIFGMSALEDQAAAGAIMWVPGSVAFLIPVLWITIRVLTPNRVRPRSASFPSSILLRRRYSQ
jgi:putative membrane protein